MASAQQESRTPEERRVGLIERTDNLEISAEDSAEETDQPPPLSDELQCLGKLAWPIAVSNLSRLLMVTVDVACLGHIGTVELAAASMASVYCELVTGLMSGPAFILNTLCAQAWGAKNYALVGVWLQIAILVITVLTPVGVVALLFTGPVLSLVGATPRVQELAGVFARISSLWVWPNMMYIAVRQYFQAQDIVRPQMVVNACFVVVNLLLNLLFIWGIPGVLNGLGFVGSPLATVVSRWLQLFTFTFYVKWRGLHAKTWMGWKWAEVLNRARICEFMSQACPYMFINVLGSGWDQLTTLIAASLGLKPLVEQSGMSTLLGPLFSVPAGIGFAIQLRVGQHLGAKQPKCAKQTWRSGIALMVAVGVFIGGTFLALAPFLGRIFSDDASVIATSRQLTPILCLIFLFGGIGSVNVSALEGQARQKLAFGVMILGHGFTTVPITFLLCFDLQWRLFGIWWGQVFGEMLCVIITQLAVWRSNWAELSEDAVHRSSPIEPAPPSTGGNHASPDP
eukprot:TRINITY_DN26953_c0_g1_i1.p1 TRINITY_DN26953_c0_g1~~TRINITY_DN26953_c0_g1_i1.p1  ORF type:complete len:511 (-),score=63.96 TRINITY_DN26953_c0_g1_i1:335-1867(-)